MVNEIIVGKIANRIASATKVPAHGKETPEEVAKKPVTDIFKAINIINSLEERAVMINGIYLSDIFVIDEFKDFIMPAAVKFDPSDLNSVNLLPKQVSNDTFDYEEFINAQLRLRSWFRSDVKSGTTSISELRKVISLYDAFPSACFTVDANIMCRAEDKPYVPIKLLDHLSHMYRKSFFNTSVEEMLNDYVNQMFV